MTRPPLPFTALAWTPDLAAALGEAMAAIARLDARICVSPFAPAWTLRASWAGYATALRLQQLELEEIDIIAEQCGLRLAGRPLPQTTGTPFDAYGPWLARLAEPEGRHWREDLPFTFDPPAGWREAPVLVRALTLLDAWALTDRSSAPWLGLPIVLRRIGITASPLPCLVAGGPGQRFALDPRTAVLKRLCKQLRRSAEDGLARLDRLEAGARRSAAAIAAEHRPGALAKLGRLALARPCLAARSVAPLLGITVSGAGKLLDRATRLDLLVEISGRGTWRSYVTPDVALALGLIAPDRGRPRTPPPSSPALDTVLATFDAEMAALDARLDLLGVGSPTGFAPTN
ncbi:hypothetical protein [Sphingobium sp. B2]|uniref:hypothetical protein n=1 Tax=Sphingobium sp. B2 TaxID=2583228 RepID=UPI0011A7671B|nr:hypothetical protein [Sphingobium sp. B2]